jgi:hypothetical protein
VQSETLSIKDNIIYLNVGDTPGTAYSAVSSGITIERGTLPDVSFLWDETVSSRNPISGTNRLGTFVFKDSAGDIKAIRTNSINTAGGDLALISSGTGVVTVTGTTDYEEQVLDYSKIGIMIAIDAVERVNSTGISTIITQTAHGFVTGNRIVVTCFSDSSFNGLFVITRESATSFSFTNPGLEVVLGSATGEVRPFAIIDDDTIPNMKAVVDYTELAVASYATNKIRENDTKVQVYDYDTSGVSEITFDVDGDEKVIINSYGLTSGNIRLGNNSVSNISNDNILLDNVLNIANKTSVPDVPVGYVKLYSKNTPGNGGTGLFFVTTAQPGLPDGIQDELVSKTRALLYSLIL